MLSESESKDFIVVYSQNTARSFTILLKEGFTFHCWENTLLVHCV